VLYETRINKDKANGSNFSVEMKVLRAVQTLQKQKQMSFVNDVATSNTQQTGSAPQVALNATTVIDADILVKCAAKEDKRSTTLNYPKPMMSEVIMMGFSYNR